MSLTCTSCGGSNPESLTKFLRGRIATDPEAGIATGQPAPTPPPCAAYPPGASQALKECMSVACLIMLIGWWSCQYISDPKQRAICEDGVKARYQDEVEACIKEHGGSA